jgi:hypothetical protein
MPFEPNWQPLPPQQALEAIERKATSEQSAEHQKIYDSFNPFNKMDQQQNFNAESYRPYIPPGYGDRKEEAKSQSQNVYLINSQTTSSKPKPKLSLTASTFSTVGAAAEPFQLPTLNVDTQKSNLGYKTSHSEPNSARNSDNKHGHKTFAQATLKEEEEDNVEGQDNNQGQYNKTVNNNNGGNQVNNQYNQQFNQQHNQPNNPQFKQQPYNQYNQQNQYNQGYPQGQGQGHGQFINQNMQQAQQFYPPQQFGYYPPQQQQQPQNFNTRQRSNSDQGATENIYFQKNYGNQYHYQNQQQQGQGFQHEYKRYSTDQGQPMGGQDQTGSYNKSGNKKNQKQNQNWSGKSSGYKKQYNKNYYNQGQQQHDESEELNEK